MLRSEYSSLIWRGAVAVALGIVAIAWPGVTVRALVALFAIYVFCDAIGHIHRAFTARQGNSKAGSILMALLDIGAGVVALVWPAITLFVLAIWVAVWAVVTGVIEIGAAFAVPARGPTRASLGIFGVISLLFGIVLFTHPHLGTLALSMLFGLFLLVYGFDLLRAAARLRSGHAEPGTLPPGEATGGWTGGGRYADADAARRTDRPAGRRW